VLLTCPEPVTGYVCLNSPTRTGERPSSEEMPSLASCRTNRAPHASSCRRGGGRGCCGNAQASSAPLAPAAGSRRVSQLPRRAPGPGDAPAVRRGLLLRAGPGRAVSGAAPLGDSVSVLRGTLGPVCALTSTKNIHPVRCMSVITVAASALHYICLSALNFTAFSWNKHRFLLLPVWWCITLAVAMMTLYVEELFAQQGSKLCGPFWQGKSQNRINPMR